MPFIICSGSPFRLQSPRFPAATGCEGCGCACTAQHPAAAAAALRRAAAKSKSQHFSTIKLLFKLHKASEAKEEFLMRQQQGQPAAAKGGPQLPKKQLLASGPKPRA